MRITLLIICWCSFLSDAQAQIVAREEMTVKVEGICNDKQVYVLFSSFNDQTQAKCSLTNDEIKALMNEKLEYLKKNPGFKGKGTVAVYINCKGDPLLWEISSKTKSAELDEQILSFFKTLRTWTPGQLQGKNVDSRVFISYRIKKGVLAVE